MAIVAREWARASGEAYIRAFGFSDPSKWAPLWANWPVKLDELRAALEVRWIDAAFQSWFTMATIYVLIRR